MVATRPFRTRRSAGRRRRSALTLLEVLVSLALIVMLMGALFTFYWEVGEARVTAAAVADRTQVARQVLSRIEAELRGCPGFEKVGFPIEQPLVEGEELDSDEFVVEELGEGAAAGDPTALLNQLLGATGARIPLLRGDRRSITFLTTALPAEEQYRFYDLNDQAHLPAAQHDLRQVSYRLWVDPQDVGDDGEPIVGGIIRTEKKTLNQFLVDYEDPLDIRNDLWSHELGYLEFRYYDGVEWDTKWDLTEGISLPHAIQITVGFKPVTLDELDNKDLDQFPPKDYPFGEQLEHPDRYTLVVKMPAADKFFGTRFQRVGQQLAEQFGVEGAPAP